MFGKDRTGTHHDFPNGLATFSQRTQHVFGDAESLARKKTLLRFFSPFTPRAEIEQAVLGMTGGSVAHLKYKLGLLTSRFRAHHPLKACQACMKADVAQHGWAYWHLSHQYPGVWICPQHCELLKVSKVKSNGVERFFWHLPAVTDLVDPCLITSDAEMDSATKLSLMTVGLVNADAPDSWLTVEALQPMLLHLLNSKGWCSASGRLRLESAANSYLDHVNRLPRISEFLGYAQDIDSAKAQLGRLLRPQRTGTHPLRWLSLMDWLFEDTASFMALHAEISMRKINESNDHGPNHDIVSDHSDQARYPDRHQQLKNLFQSGMSITAAARQIGVETVTAQAWLTKLGVSSNRRPKLVKQPLHAALVEDLRSGVCKAEVANKHGVSIQTVTRFLRTEVGLHTQWKAAVLNHARSQARREWTQATIACPGMGVKWIRMQVPRAYAWLYRNDKMWLEAHLPIGKLAVEVNGHVNWDERDRVLSQAVERAAYELAQCQTKPIKLWQLYQAVEELKPKMSVLPRLPLTTKVLEAVLKHRKKITGFGLF